MTLDLLAQQLLIVSVLMSFCITCGQAELNIPSTWPPSNYYQLEKSSRPSVLLIPSIHTSRILKTTTHSSYRKFFKYILLQRKFYKYIFSSSNCYNKIIRIMVRTQVTWTSSHKHKHYRTRCNVNFFFLFLLTSYRINMRCRGQFCTRISEHKELSFVPQHNKVRSTGLLNLRNSP